MAYENFLTYTEVDPGTHITFTAVRCTQESWHDEDAFLYYDFGAGYFTNFVHKIDVCCTAGANNRSRPFWVLTNTVDDVWGIKLAGGDFILVDFWTTIGLRLVECDAGATSSDTYAAAIGTTYYLTIEKAGTAFTCDIYSDSARTALLASLSLTLGNDYSFRYLFVGQTFNTGIAQHADGWCEKLDLGEEVINNPIICRPLICSDMVGKAKIR